MKTTSGSAKFESGLKKEIVNSELSRINIVGLLSVVLAIYTLALVVFFPELLSRLLGPTQKQQVLFILPLSFVLLIVYALLARLYLVRKIAASVECPAAYRYSTAAFEAAFPTILIFVLSAIVDPVYVLVSPIPLLYGVFILSATLQMDPKTPLIASFLASAGYLAAYFWLCDGVIPEDYPAWLIAPNAYAGRALLLVLTGLVASFLAWQIRKRVLKLAAATEEKNRIVNTFGQHVSPQVVDRLLTQKTNLGSEMRHVCVMFLDIRNFTTFSENRGPEEVVKILNELFSFMIDITNRHDGIINKFLGDGFMAVFGAPFSSGQDCVNAMNASREMLDRLQEDNRSSGREMGIGIGLHAGAALTGDVGSVERKEYTIMGDVVNVASRIESLNKTFNSQILLSEAVHEQLPQEMRNLTDLGLVSVKGREKEIRVYQLA